MTSVGIFVCCHSYLEWVREAVQSILDQTYKDLWVILVHDGYTPPTPNAEVAMMQLADNMGIAYCCFPDNRGISAVRNRGYEWAVKHELDWVTSLDDDDMLNPRYVERMLQAAESNPKVDIWYSNYTTFGDENQFSKTLDWSFDNLKRGNFILSTAFVRPRVWQAIKEKNGTGWDEELVRQGLRWEDYLFWLEAAALGFKFAPVGTGGLVRVRKHAHSGSDIANQTISQWRKYVAEKFRRVYEMELWPTSS
jgi:glycosyltransferase involved in cell wall biosynthesis